MPAFLARQIQQTLDTGVTAVSLERRAGVPGTTLQSILRGAHPRPDRLAALLTALDRESAVRWLRAYLMDDVPPDWRDNVAININPDAAHVADASPDTLPPGSPDRFLADIEWLRSQGEHDLQIVNFITDLVAILRRDKK